MARILPDGWEALEAAGAVPFEIATLRRLAAELPDDQAVYHGVHWTRMDHGCSVFGEIDFIVVGTTTPDMMFPSTACIVQHNIGATNAWGYDLLAACSGFTWPSGVKRMFMAQSSSSAVLCSGPSGRM